MKDDKKEAEAMLELVKMAREDKENGRVMSSESFRVKLAKKKQEAERK